MDGSGSPSIHPVVGGGERPKPNPRESINLELLGKVESDGERLKMIRDMLGGGEGD